MSERGEEFRALAFIHDGAARALERAHRTVAVYRDEQRVAETARLREVAHVADVQDVEAPVREDEPAPFRAQPSARAQQLFETENNPAAHCRLTKNLTRPESFQLSAVGFRTCADC